MGKPSQSQTELTLAARYSHFQRLLAANNQVLYLMSDLGEKLSGDFLFDLQYIRSLCSRLAEQTGEMVAALNGLGNNRYLELEEARQRIVAEVEDILNRRREIPPAPFVMFFEELPQEAVEIGGGKNANLAQVKNRLKLPVPNGFAITTSAYKAFLDHNHLAERITEMLSQWSMADLDTLGRVSEELKKMIRQAEMPPPLAEAIQVAYDRLARQEGGHPRLAVRSSAVGEDLAFTFAGQYATYLNVKPEDLIARYKAIIASLFTARALFYYKNKGFKEEEMSMGVVVMPIICSKASGVLFTRRPDPGEPDGILINAVWGLGKYAVAGRVNPDYYLIAYDPPGAILEQSIPAKPVMLVCQSEGGVAEVPTPPDIVETACLSHNHLQTMAKWAAVLEQHFQKPQDVEWALDSQDRLWLLQSRRLRVAAKKQVSVRPRTLTDYHVLLDGGVVASRGVGAGPVVIVRQDQDLKNFPNGGVLVARHSSPKFVTVMHQTAAIITDGGSPTGHMALLAREFRVPAILNTGNATQVLSPGQVVTVDANYKNVYAGRVEELLTPMPADDDELTETPVFQTLKAIAKKVAPLNLVNPQDPTFAPAYCQTIHDIVRFAHEYSMRDMFNLREGFDKNEGEACDLESDLPFKIRMLDMGGGLKSAGGRRVRPKDITSIPFKAFWEGVRAMRWPQGKPTSTTSLSSIFVKTEEELAEGETPYRDQSYALVSDNYMNFSIHLGYHFSSVEAYVSDQINDNYLTFHFHGGGSTPERRERRARLIETIIDHLHLQYKRKGDIIEARLAKYPRAQMLQRLVIMGKLTSYTKQLDMVLFSDGIVDWYINDFVREHITGKIID
ncbi:PEP/pyruvate-binding domain-containing protein [Desulfobacca acetoxidans]